MRGRVARKVCRVWSLRVSPWSVPVEAAEAAPGVVAAGLRATFMGFLTSKSSPRTVFSVGDRFAAAVQTLCATPVPGLANGPTPGIVRIGSAVNFR